MSYIIQRKTRTSATKRQSVWTIKCQTLVHLDFHIVLATMLDSFVRPFIEFDACSDPLEPSCPVLVYFQDSAFKGEVLQSLNASRGIGIIFLIDLVIEVHRSTATNTLKPKYSCSPNFF